MSLQQMQPALEALGELAGHQVSVSVEHTAGNLGAWAKMVGELGRPQIDGNHVFMPVGDASTGFTIDANQFETWGQGYGNVRLVADGLAILISPESNEPDESFLLKFTED